jgi:hypothetical protein
MADGRAIERRGFGLFRVGVGTRLQKIPANFTA